MFEKMCSMENLELAYINARKGKLRTYGVKMFEKDKENNLRVLQTDLLSLNFKTSKYHTFTINEYGKDRVISRLPFYPGRIVHHLLMLELEKIWVKVFIRNTYACIKGRGIGDKVIFTGSGMLKMQIEQINKEDFPFLATIESINETYQFQ